MRNCSPTPFFQACGLTRRVRIQRLDDAGCNGIFQGLAKAIIGMPEYGRQLYAQYVVARAECCQSMTKRQLQIFDR